MRDPKNAFYRTLELDDESKAALKWYRANKKKIMESSESNNQKKDKKYGN